MLKYEQKSNFDSNIIDAYFLTWILTFCQTPLTGQWLFLSSSGLRSEAGAFNQLGFHFYTLVGHLAQSGASLTANQGVAFEPQSGHILKLRFGHENISTTILSLPLIQEGQL